MHVHPLAIPRRFTVGGVDLTHVADVQLEDDELVTFRADSGTEYDVVRKSWGYYPIPSLNRRLPDHGLRPVLVRDDRGTRTLLLCERGRERAFEEYLAKQRLKVVGWLEDEPCPMCGGLRLEHWHRYVNPPEGETRFEMKGQPYVREVSRCVSCGHYVSQTSLDLSHLYKGAYVDATYAGKQLGAAFDRVMALPHTESDNAARVDRIVNEVKTGSVLDVGSGLSVFPARMLQAGWTVTALDPDPRACDHIRDRTGVPTIEADFLTVDITSLGRFDLVTLNKVLEHVEDPVAMLARALKVLTGPGVVYIELPDGEGAAMDGPGREEFFIEHLHVYSMASMAHLIQRAGLRARRIERLREPSGKFTLFAFCEQAV
jgi:SAM-dependent methyltransferase